ncbi:MAG: DUF2007 domain-containing protein [Thermoleophilia bacterium]
MKPVTVTSVNDVGLASIIKGILEQAGIETVLQGTGTEDVFPAGVVENLDVMVDESEVDRARDLLDQFETSPEVDEDDEA